MLEAHLSNVSNRLNEVMKFLTIFSVIFMPMTVLTGMYGMNVPLRALPGRRAARSSGGSSASWPTLSGVLIWFFRSKRWL